MRRIRPISHEDRLSVVDHLDELRSRLIVCVVAFAVAWALTAWQNHLVLEIVNAPLPNDIEPITLGPAEAFYTTLTNSAYAALLISLPVILYQLYAFLLPAFSPNEKRVAVPMMLMVPVLFIVGVRVLLLRRAHAGDALPAQLQRRRVQHAGPRARLLLVRDAADARDGHRLPDPGRRSWSPASCASPTRSSCAAAAATRSLVIVVLAALLPTIDPLSLILESIPMYLLYELSILLASAWGQPLGEATPDDLGAEPTH